MLYPDNDNNDTGNPNSGGGQSGGSDPFLLAFLVIVSMLGFTLILKEGGGAISASTALVILGVVALLGLLVIQIKAPTKSAKRTSKASGLKDVKSSISGHRSFTEHLAAPHCHLEPEFLQELARIQESMLRKDPDIAALLARAVVETLTFISKMPGRGHLQKGQAIDAEGLRSLRVFGFDEFLISYKVLSSEVHVLHLQFNSSPPSSPYTQDEC